jgi:hypothetical protein
MSKPFILPGGILKQHLIALGKTGSAKSSALRYIVEHLLRKKKRVCIVDPKGDWWGLKVDASGRGAGFPVVLFGDFKNPKARDVPINQASGKHIAELVSGGNRPCVIGLGGWQQAAMTQFWIDFASTLFAKNAGELYLVVDEFHNFAPKGKILSPQAGLCLHWSNRLLSEGRGLGIVCLNASQRPQKVHNDSLTSHETLLAKRVVHKADRDAIKDWIDGNGDPQIGKEILASIAGMPRPDAWVWSPEIRFGPKRVTFPMFKTFDSFAPPQLQKRVSGKSWASVDLAAVKEKLAAVIEEQQANDPKFLRAEMLRLRSELDKARQQKPVAAPAKAPKVVEKLVLKDQQIARVAKIVSGLRERDQKLIVSFKSINDQTSAALEKLVAGLRDRDQKLAATFKSITDQTSAACDKLSASLASANHRPAIGAPPAASPNPAMRRTPRMVPATVAPLRAGSNGAEAAAKPARDLHGREDLSDLEKRVLDSIAFFESIGVGEPSDAAVALKAGSSPTSSTYERHRSKLRGAGLITFPDARSDKRALTERGRELAQYPASAGTLKQLQDDVMKELDDSKRTLLANLIRAYPRALTNQELAEASGTSHTSSTFERHRSKLRKFGLIDYRDGGVAAAEILFPARLIGKSHEFATDAQ